MKNFVFDLYGTLVDIRTVEHSPKFKAEYLQYIKKFGADDTFFENFSAKLSQYSRFDEPDIVKVISGAVEASGGQMTELSAVEASLEFRMLSTQRLKLYCGVKKLLKSLKRKGAKLYLLSNAQAVFTIYELNKLGIYKYFDGIELSSDFGKKKPSPDFFAHIVKKYSLSVCETVYTGNDIACDIVPSKQAGMHAVYIKSLISPAEDDLLKAQELADFATDDTATAYKYLIKL